MSASPEVPTSIGVRNKSAALADEYARLLLARGRLPYQQTVRQQRECQERDLVIAGRRGSGRRSVTQGGKQRRRHEAARRRGSPSVDNKEEGGEPASHHDTAGGGSHPPPREISLGFVHVTRCCLIDPARDVGSQCARALYSDDKPAPLARAMQNNRAELALALACGVTRFEEHARCNTQNLSAERRATRRRSPRKISLEQDNFHPRPCLMRERAALFIFILFFRPGRAFLRTQCNTAGDNSGLAAPA